MVSEDPAPTLRLPTHTRPTAEAIELHVDPTQDRFTGAVDLAVTLDEPRRVIWLHGHGLHVTRATVTPDGGAAQDAAWKQNDEDGTSSLTVLAAIPAGKAKLHVEYDAALGVRPEGLYKVTEAGTPYAFTQFESTWARMAFPCFDEPGIKIPFDVTLVVPSGDEAIANTREIERKADGASVRVRFATTVPLPSYLVAFAVGPLDVVPAADVPPNPVRKRLLPLRGIAPKGHGKDMLYALQHAGEILSVLEQIFGVEYPFDKLDILAVPGMAGAMENAGAVTFADNVLLFDERTAPFHRVRDYADYLAHELAHQWVGDLVTAAWWDDIWLNESFANWVGARAAETWDPRMDTRRRLLDGVQDAIGTDGLVSARAIRQPIESANDIENAFDSLTYEKGGSVLAMFERWLGPAAFQRGLHDYLVKHAQGNATADDFLDAESAATGKDVKTPFHTFLDQPGVPFVEAEVKCDGSPHLHLKQSRYLPAGSKGDANRTWQVPLCARYAAGKDQKEACTLLTEREGDLPLGDTCPDWVFPNADSAGYFRFALAPADTAKLRAVGLAKLSARERIAYGNSLRAAFSKTTLPMKDAIDAAAPLANDPYPSVVREPMSFLAEAHDWLFTDPARAAVEGYERRLFAAQYKKLGWAPARGEAPERTRLRDAVLSFLVLDARDPAARAEAKRRGLAFLGYKGKVAPKDGAVRRDAVDPNAIDVVLAALGQDADRALFDDVKARFAKAEDAELREDYLLLLSRAERPEIAASVLDLALDPSLRPVEVLIPLSLQLSSPGTREATWQWIKAHFDALLTAVPKDGGQAHLVELESVFCDDDHARDVEAFFTPERLAKIDGGPRVLASTLEEIHLCATRRKAQEPSAREMFGKKP